MNTTQMSTEPLWRLGRPNLAGMSRGLRIMIYIATLATLASMSLMLVAQAATAEKPHWIRQTSEMVAFIGLWSGCILVVGGSRHYLLGLPGLAVRGFVAIMLATFAGTLLYLSSTTYRTRIECRVARKSIRSRCCYARNNRVRWCGVAYDDRVGSRTNCCGADGNHSRNWVSVPSYGASSAHGSDGAAAIRGPEPDSGTNPNCRPARGPHPGRERGRMGCWLCPRWAVDGFTAYDSRIGRSVHLRSRDGMGPARNRWSASHVAGRLLRCVAHHTQCRC